MPPTRRSLLLAAVLLLAACAAPRAPRASEEPLHLVVLHTNDVHGQLAPRRGEGGLRRLVAEIEKVRAGLGPEDALLLVDAGDWFQGTPEGRVDHGGEFVALLGLVGYDAMAVGNHELDHGVAHLERLLAAHPLPAVCANVVDPATGGRVPWGEPWRIVERGGLRIALVGLLTPETPSITHASARALAFADPVDALRDALAALEGEADLVIPLTHLGLRDDQRIAEALDVPLVVGGHSHTRLLSGARTGKTLIVQTGANARALGRVDLWIERATGAIERAEATLLDLDEPSGGAPLPPAFSAACDALAARAAADMDRVVGRLAAPLERKGGILASSTAGNLIADVFRARTGTPIAVHNKGGIRASLDAGAVTRRDVFELLPFDNSLVVLDVTGAELVEAIRRAVEEPEHSGIEVSGLVVRVAQPGAAKSPLLAVELAGGAPVDPRERYRVATNSFLAGGGDGYFDPDVIVAVDTGLLMRDLVEDTLREAGAAGIDPPADERFLPGERGR
jgi:2',3'-cyclic-nucleotide 2'-phosphodiesterase (5'-nucleotidase family)